MPSVTNISQQPHPNWGQDQLTAFFQLGEQATWASIVDPSTRPWFEKLREADSTFVDALKALNGPTPNFFEGLMLASAHAAFRSAAQFALGGRTCEAMVLLRSSLEYAMYGVHFHRKPELIEVWSKRGDGEAQRKAVRKAFKSTEMLDGISTLNNAVGSRCKRLYELTIDMGAHPNEMGFYGRLKIEDVPGTANKIFMIKYLSGGDSSHLATLKNACSVGVCVLECFRLVYRHRFDIMQVTVKIDGLKAGL